MLGTKRNMMIYLGEGLQCLFDQTTVISECGVFLEFDR